MNLPLRRRVCGLEQARAARRRTHYLWRDTDKTPDQVDARIRAMIASGEASRGDQFVIYSWKSPEGGE